MANRALILANGQFDDPAIPNLASPVPDGEALADLLERADVGGYAVTVVRDQPTSVVRLATQRFFAEAGPDDLLILYLSGHGMKDRRGNLHFVTKDTVRDALAATAVEARYFHERMRESQAARQVVFVDTCYSGAFAEGGGFKSVDIAVDRADFTGSAADEADEDEGIAIYTASAGNQVAQEKADADAGAHRSVFTRHLIEGIATGAADPKQTGWITLEGLFGHIRRELKREGAGQTPQRLLARLPGTVKVAKNPAAQVELPEPLRTALAGDDRIARLAAVDDLLALAQGEAVLLADKARAALQALALDKYTSVATAAREALARLGPVEAEDAAETARRQQEEARLKAEADALERRRAEVEARERAAAEQAEQRKREEYEHQRRLFEERERARRERERAEAEADRPEEARRPEPVPPKKKSGIGRILAIAAVVLVGLAVVGAVIDGMESGRISSSDVGLDTTEPDSTYPDYVGPPSAPPQGLQEAPAPGIAEQQANAVAAIPEPAPQQPMAPANMGPGFAASLATYLSAMARPSLPQPLGPMGVLTDIEAQGARIIFHVQSAEFVPPEAIPLLQQQLGQIAAADCQGNVMVTQFIAAGGVRIYRFTSSNGVQFEVVHDRC